MVELHWSEVVRSEGVGVVPCGLRCVVVVYGTVDHRFERLVVLSMDDEFVELFA